MSCKHKREAELWDFGGVSAISHQSGTFYMTTEGNPYVYAVNMDLEAARPGLAIERKITLSDGPAQQELSKIEAMAACNGRFILGTEGIPADELAADEPQDIRLFMTDLEGAYVDDIELPEAFVREGDARGAVLYRGIQGLSCSPDGTTLLLSLQLPLQQDGGPAPGPTRQLLMTWDEQGERFVVDRSVYVDITTDLGIMGSELVDNDGRAVLLESSSEPEISNDLHVVELSKGDDVSECTSLLPDQGCEGLAAAPKSTLIERFERYSGQDLSAHEVQYDALGIGPPLEDGRTTLLVATDDDHCGSISNPMATEAPGFSGTTFTIFAIPAD